MESAEFQSLFKSEISGIHVARMRWCGTVVLGFGSRSFGKTTCGRKNSGGGVVQSSEVPVKIRDCVRSSRKWWGLEATCPRCGQHDLVYSYP